MADAHPQDARREDLAHRLDALADRLNTRMDRLEERVRHLEQHTTAVLDQIIALRRGLDEALSDILEEEGEADEAATAPPSMDLRH